MDSDGANGAAGAHGAAGTNGSGGGPSMADLTGIDPQGGGDGGATGGAGAGGGDAGAVGGGAGDGQGGEAGGAVDPAWYAEVSDQVDDGEKVALRDFLKSSGVKDINTLVQRFRDTQRALHEGGKVKVPGEGASAAEIKAYRTAIGVPEDAKGYALDPIKDGNGHDVPLDGAILDRLATRAFQDGVPKAAYQSLVTEYVTAQVEQMALDDAEQKAAATAKLKEWGTQANAKSHAVDAGLAALGIDRDETLKLRAALGAGRAMEIFAKLGEGIAEDTLVNGDSRRPARFGISGAQAQEQIKAMIADRTIADKIRIPGTPENARYERLQMIVGEEANRKAATMQ